MSFNQAWSASIIASLQAYVSGGDTEHLMAVQTSSPKSFYESRYDPFLRVCGISHYLFLKLVSAIF